MTPTQLRIVEADPRGPDALDLLRLAAMEARDLYPELDDPDARWPTNAATPPRGAYVLAWSGDQAVGMAAHRPLDHTATEVRRMYVRQDARRSGVARALLLRIEHHAGVAGFTRLLLETGNRQTAAMALYESCGFTRIDAFGEHGDDPTSVCYAKNVLPPAGVAG